MNRPAPGVYGFSPGSGGVHHYRIAEPLRVAAKHGIATGTGKVLDDDVCGRFDTILAHMLHYEHTADAWEQLAAGGRHRLVLDVDDAMWWPEWAPFRESYGSAVLQRLYRAVELAHVVTTPSPVIAEYLSGINRNVWVVPNTVPGYLLFQNQRTRPRETVGWQGGISHQPDMTPEFLRQLLRFLARSRWLYKAWGAEPEWFYHFPRGMVEAVPWKSDLRRYYRSLSMDIGIGPLKQCAFNDCKSSLRAVEYAALGIPAILSKTRAYEGWVDEGVTGYLVEEHEWYEALWALSQNPELRQEMSGNARRKAIMWTTEENIGKWTEAWGSV